MSLKLAIVDDAPFIREILRTVARQNDFEIVWEAVNGQEAVEHAGNEQPDVILMDIVMPVMSGIEATVKILETFPTIKIIACSTVDQESMVVRALEAGCCDYIKKPFRADELAAAIRASVAPPSDDSTAEEIQP